MGEDVLVFRDRLKQSREQKGLTYEDMAGKLGYRSKSTYMYIETGRTVPTLPIMRKISKFLENEVGYFFNIDVRDNRTNSQVI